MLCEVATSQLEALHFGAHLEHHSTQLQQCKGKSRADTPQTHRATDSADHSAHRALSVPYPHVSVGLTQLSTVLSTISAASQGMCSGQEVECEHHKAVERLQELMMQTTKQQPMLFNQAVEVACRYQSLFSPLALLPFAFTPMPAFAVAICLCFALPFAWLLGMPRS